MSSKFKELIFSFIILGLYVIFLVCTPINASILGFKFCLIVFLSGVGLADFSQWLYKKIFKK